MLTLEECLTGLQWHADTETEPPAEVLAEAEEWYEVLLMYGDDENADRLCHLLDAFTGVATD